MGDRSPKSKQRDRTQKRATEAKVVAAPKSKQEGYVKRVAATGKK